MAESKEDLDHLTCSICVDVYREPVSLPCNHSYCRQCLHMFADRAKHSGQDDSPSDAAGGASGHVTISCPVCRTSSILGPEGVAGLPVNTQLAKAVNQANSGIKECPSDDSGPSCSMCEGDDKSAAVKVCTTCNNGVLYCEECCSVLHPMRGPFKHHTLVSVEDYLSLQTVTGVEDEPEASPPPKCPLHNQPFSIYCISCQAIICNGCLNVHNEHTMGDIHSAYEKVKASFTDKMTSCEGMKTRLLEFADGFDALQEKIQGNEDLHTEDMEKTYKLALETLNAWKKISLELVGKRLADRRLDCKTGAKDLRMKAEELESFMDRGHNILSTTTEKFLQSSTELLKRIDGQLQELTKAIEIQRDTKELVRKSLLLDPVTPRHLVVGEAIHGKVVSRPPLRFTPPEHSTAEISEEGLLLRLDESLIQKPYSVRTDGVFLIQNEYSVRTDGVFLIQNEYSVRTDGVFLIQNEYSVRTDGVFLIQNEYSVRTDGVFLIQNEYSVRTDGVFLIQNEYSVRTDGVFLIQNEYSVRTDGVFLIQNEYNVMTDGVFRAGRYYWEVDITVTMTGSADCEVWCAVGLVRSLSEMWASPGKTPWWFVIQYSPNDSEFLYLSGCTCTYISPRSGNKFSHTGSHRLGLYLSFEERTLTLVDCSHNRVVFTYGDVDVSQPLISAFSGKIYKGKAQVSLFARLIHGDCSDLPQILMDSLKKNNKYLKCIGTL